MRITKAAARSRGEREKSLEGDGTKGGEMETMRKKGERTDRKAEKEEREETLSLGITITEQVKRDKCQRTLGKIKQQLAWTHPGKHKSATVRESPGLWSK